ncbi:hypothetical protein GCM10011359_09470 [Nesterenkonia alkaliphila]|nr:hypothetical protein GCM10011359_09470 [Nesterenkonia alkaliphila]
MFERGAGTNSGFERGAGIGKAQLSENPGWQGGYADVENFVVRSGLAGVIPGQRTAIELGNGHLRGPSVVGPERDGNETRTVGWALGAHPTALGQALLDGAEQEQQG